MVDTVAFFGFIVLPSLALVSAIGLSGYEIYRIGEYRLVIIIVLLGVMLQHQLLEWAAFWSTGRVTESVLGESFETTANLVASGGVYYLLALLRRERMLTEERDRREREFRSMVKSAPIPMLYHCPNQIRLVNEATVSMLGGDESTDFIGRSLSEFVVSDNREMINAVIKQTKDPDAFQGEQLTLETVDGKRRYAVFSAQPLRFDGRDGIQITLNDITEREESRRELEQTRDRLQTLFHNIQDGVLVIDLDDERIIDANESACKMLGYSKSELTQLQPKDIHPHEPDQLESFLNTVKREEMLTTEELSCRRKDGGRFAAEVSAGITRVNGNRWLLVSIRDATERKRRNQQLDFLHRLFRHNVRNRMNIIVGNANRLKNRGDDEIAEIAGSISSVGDRFVETSEKIRQITRIIRDGVQLEVEQTNISAVVENLVESYREHEPTVSFEVKIQDGVLIRGDKSIQMAIDNLLENAIEHGGDDPTVRITVKADSLGSGMAEIVIEDDGPGIPDNERVVASDPEAQTQLEHGSGLGLHLVTQAVAVYGGDFSLECPADEEIGTRATIQLPRPVEAIAGQVGRSEV